MMRVAFRIDDDLQEYAESVRGLPLWPPHGDALREVESTQSVVLRRDGLFQVELFCVGGGFLIPEHRHATVDTIEVGIAGAVRLTVNGEDPFARVPDDRLGAFTRGRGIRINRADLHGGRVLSGGAWFLSVQRWDREPSSVLLDFVGPSVGEMHRQMRGVRC